MEEVKKEEVNSETIKEITFTALSSSVSDNNCNAALLNLAHRRKTGPTRRSTKGGWTRMEDDVLTEAVKRFNGKNWKKIAELFPGRTDVQCLHRWQKVLNPSLVKGPWIKEEDDCIIELVKKYGHRKWSEIAKSLPGRIGKQCRERWYNHLNPGIKKDAWTKEEEFVLIHAHRLYGNKWAEIGKLLPGRADNSIKNHWNCSVKKKLDSYLASGFSGDLPGIINIPDLYDHERKYECGKALKKIPQTVGSVDHKTELKGSADSSLGVLGSGNFDKGEEDLQSHVKIEISGFSKVEINDRKPLIGIHVGGEYATASGPNSERGEKHVNLAIMLDDLHCPSSNVFHPEIPLGISLGDPTKFLHSQKSTLEPGDHNDLSSSRPPSGQVTLTTSDSNVPFSSLLACEFGSENGQVHAQSEVPVTTLYSDDRNFSSLYSESPKQNLYNDLENSRFLSTDKYIQPAEIIACSTPPIHVQSIPLSGCIESILRTAAKSFKNTPSIIRKRKHETSRQAANANDSDGLCTPEVRNGSSNDTQCSAHSWPHILRGQDKLSRTDLTVKWLSASSPDSLQPETTTSVKSVEKCLEYAFDMEWDSSKAKCSTIATASHFSNANNGLMAFDNSPDSSRERLKDLHRSW